MRQTITISLAVTALSALSAIATSIATASFPRYLPSNGGTFPVKFTGFAGAGTLAIKGGNTSECQKTKISGEILNDTNLIATID